MLKNSAWRVVIKLWVEELEKWSKLCVLKSWLIKGGFEASCVGVRRKMIRRILMKLAKAGGYSRAAGGGGEMERFEEGGEKVYRM